MQHLSLVRGSRRAPCRGVLVLHSAAMAGWPRQWAFLFFLAVITPCSLARASEATSPLQDRIVHADNRLGLDLFARLYSSSPDRNVFISPLSISTALAMVYNGAAGATQVEMARTLGLAGLSLAEVNGANLSLLSTTRKTASSMAIEVANSLWGRRGFVFRPDFLQRTQSSYGARITALDFSSPSAASTINQWVKESTHDRIDRIVDRTTPQDVLFLINAVYFKGAWSSAFLKAATRNHPFTLSSGRKQTTPTMYSGRRFSYLETSTFQAVRLPYRAGNMSMYVFLPRPNVGITRLCRSLSLKNWDEWMGRFELEYGVLGLPRFTCTYGVELIDTLSGMGMKSAFTPRADFTGMSTTRQPYLSEVLHKTFLRVDEAGTEAAAVTSVGVTASAASPEPQRSFRMIVDHPFLCVIRDDDTRAILFLGSIVQP